SPIFSLDLPSRRRPRHRRRPRERRHRARSRRSPPQPARQRRQNSRLRLRGPRLSEADGHSPSHVDSARRHAMGRLAPKSRTRSQRHASSNPLGRTPKNQSRRLSNPPPQLQPRPTLGLERANSRQLSAGQRPVQPSVIPTEVEGPLFDLSTAGGQGI